MSALLRRISMDTSVNLMFAGLCLCEFGRWLHALSVLT